MEKKKLLLICGKCFNSDNDRSLYRSLQADNGDSMLQTLGLWLVKCINYTLQHSAVQYEN